MGLKVSAREAARLSNKTERTVRRWVAEGRLAAEPVGLREPGPGVGPGRWLLDVDELARIPGVTLDRARLAELELRAREAELGTSLVERVSRLEEGLGALQRRMAEVEAQLHRLRGDRDNT